MNTEDILQESLARLEAGESVEDCLAGLSDEQADLLETAAAIRSISYPERAVNHVTAQRARLLRVVREHGSDEPLRRPLLRPLRGADEPPHRPLLGVLNMPLLRPLRAWLEALPRPAVYGLAGAAIIVLLIMATVLRPPAQPGTDVAVNPTDLAYTVNIPIVNSSVHAPDPHSAVLGDRRGVVEVSSSDGRWAALSTGQVVQAGQRVRTGSLSSATLLFYDGSRARLGAATEVSIDELDANTSGPRVVALTQVSGETDHDVVPSSDPGSRYEARTPSGSGVAKGTFFHVSVSDSLVTRISVDEGAVAVTNLNITVIVIAGQTTTVHTDAPPEEPTFRVTGEGVVTQIGVTWNIGGLEFQTDDDTVIVGNPKVGDFVSVDGHLLDDGTRVADLIVLLHRAEENRFAFTGTVDAIGDGEWTIAGRVVEVNDETNIEDGIESGDLVAVEGIVQPDGTLVAESIRLLNEAGLPFEFTGVVESMEDAAWTISGVEVTVDGDTEIEAGIVAGDIVKVEGRILEDGTWLAKEIKLAEEDERDFEFTGVVQSIDPWTVSGIGFETDDETEVEDGIEVGDRVKVEGRVLDEGTWLAEEIRLLDDQERRFEFVGEVDSIDPWVVGGLDIPVDADTEIDDDIEVGDRVRVTGVILPDGTLLAERIQRLDDELGCADIRTIVVSIDGNRIVLDNGQTIELDDSIEVEGDLGVDSIIIIRICIDEDGRLIVISIIIIDVLPPPSPTPPPATPPPGEGGSVTLCHIPPGNPSNAHTITVDAASVSGHLAHGDHLGACGDGDDDDDDRGKDKKKDDDD